jgi:hypothetical protein
MERIIELAISASLRGKLSPNLDANLPLYIDDYEGKTEQELKQIWGIED